MGPAMKTVVVADDDPCVRKLVRTLLEHELAYRVCEAANGTDALQLTQQLHPSLAILDGQMPGLTGNQVCVALRTHPATQDIPLLLLSADSEPDVQGHLLFPGPDAFVHKPFELQDLVA